MSRRAVLVDAMGHRGGPARRRGRRDAAGAAATARFGLATRRHPDASGDCGGLPRAHRPLRWARLRVGSRSGRRARRAVVRGRDRPRRRHAGARSPDVPRQCPGSGRRRDSNHAGTLPVGGPGTGVVSTRRRAEGCHRRRPATRRFWRGRASRVPEGRVAVAGLVHGDRRPGMAERRQHVARRSVVPARAGLAAVSDAGAGGDGGAVRASGRDVAAVGWPDAASPRRGPGRVGCPRRGGAAGS